MPGSYTEILRDELLPLDGITRLAPARRFTAVYRDGDAADRFFFLTSGLVKIFHRDAEGKEVILRIVTPGELFGEEAFSSTALRDSSAEVLQESVIHSIPREVLLSFAETRPGLWPMISASLASRQQDLERKIELLCLRDVEHRILFSLRHLAQRLRRDGQDADFEIPLSQSELASLIGATRETTSTTLNSLARQGVLKLGRRMLIVPALEPAAAPAGHPADGDAAPAPLSATALAGSNQ